MRIGKIEISKKSVFIIAEIGNNHNGCVDRAVEMVDQARRAGADCVKFQMRHLDKVYRQKSLNKNGDDLGTEYILDLLKRFELSVNQHKKIIEYCKQIDVMYMCTPWDCKSISVLEEFGVPAYKVASADLTNLPLLDAIIKTGKPLILSTGMSTVDEVRESVKFLRDRDADFALLHCNSTYPAPIQDINLKWINSLQEIHPIVGYSGHERGINISLAAVAIGSCIVERHFTLDRNMEGPDHAASLTAPEFRRMVEGIREIEVALGDGKTRIISQGEMINRENLGKSLVASMPLKIGTVLRSEHIKICSPGQGISPQQYQNLIGRTLRRNVDEEDYFYMSDLTDTNVEVGFYSFNRPWGVPVRYHDFKDYSKMIQPDIWEFHLSYSDMDLDPSKYIAVETNAGFVVHAPELFSGSRLMDLATPDDEYREKSIIETQKVINITRALKKHFPICVKPLIVANIGGFSMDGPLDSWEIDGYYARFEHSLVQLDTDGVEIIPQTMAPFPWHFGGQRYQNLFVNIDEIIKWCSKLGMRMCFDVSHSYLACNHSGEDFYEFTKKISPFIAHIHFGDAKGLNGEGLQIGQGEIDFPRLGKILRDHCPSASFIPEIWQGHKNGGEGFWLALKQLEKYL
jgi:sialic acid synthase SpsE/sugar phosphate isomerase/epimerase